MKNLYHYTSFESFIKIIGSHKLRFYDVKKSNDYLEIEHLWNSVIENVDVFNINDKLLELLHYDQNNVTDYLGICFSEICGSMILYNVYHSDICIGFDYEGIKKWANQISFIDNKIKYSPLESNNNFCKLKKVEYLNRDNIVDIVKKHCDNDPVDNFNNILDYLRDNEFSVKTKDWEYEKEHRCILPIIYNNQKNSENIIYENEGSISRIETQYSEDVYYKQYCDVCFDRGIIKEIVLKPGSKIEISDIKKILISSGYDVDSIDIYVLYEKGDIANEQK